MRRKESREKEGRREGKEREGGKRSTLGASPVYVFFLGIRM